MDFEAIRARLAKTKGKEYWRSLEELAGSEAFQESLRREFPNGASEWSDVAGRRNFLRLMGASLALAGLTACTRQPTETIVPYVHPALGITLGEPLMGFQGILRGVPELVDDPKNLLDTASK